MKNQYPKMKDEKIQFLKFALFFGFFIFFIFGARATNAATLYFSPSSGNYTVGNILNASVLVNTQGQATNNSSAVINFPTALLEVISVSKSGSIFSLWVEEPAFSNSAGVISFDGGLSTPGYNGSAGRLLNITFRVRNAGTASLVFSSGAVRANDGYGTDILQTRGQAQFNLISEEGPPVPPPPTLGSPQAPKISSPTPTDSLQPSLVGVPLAPVVRSATHPDSEKWYANNVPVFSWDVPDDVTAVRLLVGKLPHAVPTVTYTPAITSKELDNLEDGIWYFSTQLRNGAGWGAISRFRFQIDTQPPKPFSIEFVHGKETIDPSPIIAFNTTDELSGINYYKIKIGNGDFFEIDPNLILSKPYALPPQDPGKNTVVVQAYDKAGNAASAVEEFYILALASPKITRYQENVAEGDLLEVGGKTYPDSDVDLFLLQEGKKVLEQRVKSNSSGDFTFIWSKKLGSGVYDVQARITDNRGAKSLLSEKITIVVARPAILKVGSWAVSLLAVVVPLVALIFILLFIIWYGWHIFASFRKKLKNVRKEVREAESAVHKAFDMLKEDIREQVKLLEKTRTKRQLTEEEEKIIKQLGKDLDDAEKFVRKEIEDIEKAVK